MFRAIVQVPSRWMSPESAFSGRFRAAPGKSRMTLTAAGHHAISRCSPSRWHER